MKNEAAPQPKQPRGETEVNRAIAEVTQLAGGLAHELRNPLSTIMIQMDLLVEDLQDPSADPADVRRRALRKLDILRREAKRLQALFDKFLTLTGPCRLRRANVDLNVVIQRLAEFFQPQAYASGIELTIETAAMPVRCAVDEGMIRQALLNIVINAQQAMPDGGTLRIASCVNGCWGLISVTDTGPGIADCDRDQILRPFFSTKSGGSGLGLSITRRIVNEHGGTLTFEEAVDGGTTFMIRLPLADDGSSHAPSDGC